MCTTINHWKMYTTSTPAINGCICLVKWKWQCWSVTYQMSPSITGAQTVAHRPHVACAAPRRLKEVTIVCGPQWALNNSADTETVVSVHLWCMRVSYFLTRWQVAGHSPVWGWVRWGGRCRQCLWLCGWGCGPQRTVHLQIWPSGLKVCAPLVYNIISSLNTLFCWHWSCHKLVSDYQLSQCRQLQCQRCQYVWCELQRQLYRHR